MPYQIGAKTSPAEAAANYKTGAGAKGAKYATNALRPKRNPFEAASAAASTWLANVNSAGTKGFQAGLARVNQEAVAQYIQTYGAARYTEGVANKGSPRYAAAAQSLIPAIQQAAANLPARGTAAENDARMNQMVAQLRAMRGQFRAK